MKRFIAAAIVAIAGFAPVFPASLEELVGPEQAAALRAGGQTVTEAQLKNPAPLLLPRHDELRRLVAENMAGLEPGILVETLYVYQKPRGPAGASEDGSWTEHERTGLFNKILAISTLTGIQYYSASRKAMRTFYESSSVIAGPNSKTAVPDPVCSTPPSAFTLYARQKDLTFGDNVYRYDYRSGPDMFVFLQENLTSMTVGIIPVVGKNRLRVLLGIVDAGECLLIYTAAMAKAASIPGMGERIGSSFTNRVQAVLKWFVDGADKVFR